MILRSLFLYWHRLKNDDENTPKTTVFRCWFQLLVVLHYYFEIYFTFGLESEFKAICIYNLSISIMCQNEFNVTRYELIVMGKYCQHVNNIYDWVWYREKDNHFCNEQTIQFKNKNC